MFLPVRYKETRKDGFNIRIGQPAKDVPDLNFIIFALFKYLIISGPILFRDLCFKVDLLRKRIGCSRLKFNI